MGKISAGDDHGVFVTFPYGVAKDHSELIVFFAAETGKRDRQDSEVTAILQNEIEGNENPVIQIVGNAVFLHDAVVDRPCGNAFSRRFFSDDLRKIGIVVESHQDFFNAEGGKIAADPLGGRHIEMIVKAGAVRCDDNHGLRAQFADAPRDLMKSVGCFLHLVGLLLPDLRQCRRGVRQ